MKQRKTYYRRKQGKIIAEGKRNNKTIFLFTLPPPDELAKSSLFTEEKRAKILEKINRLDIKQPKESNKVSKVRTIDVVGSFERDDKFNPEEEINELKKVYKNFQNQVALNFINKYNQTLNVKNLLDIGCADQVIKPFLPQNIIYHSLDVKDYEGIIHEFKIDLNKEKIPIEDNHFDIVMCLATLEHTLYPKKIVKEIKRIAKDNALFIFSLPNEYNFLQRIYYLFGKKCHSDSPWIIVEEHLHIHKPRVKDIINLFKEDFEIKEVKYLWLSRASNFSKFNKFFIFMDKIINFLAQIIPNLFAREVIMVCKTKLKLN